MVEDGTEIESFLVDDEDDLDVTEDEKVNVEVGKAAEAAEKTEESEESDGAKPEETSEASPQGKEEPEEKSKEETKEDVAQPAAESPADASDKPPTTEAQPLSPEEARQQYEQWRGTAIEELAQHYALSEDEVADIETDLAAVLPKFGARLYVDAVTTAVHRVTEALPEMIDALLQQREVGQSQEQKFFEAWPQLREHGETVMQFGRVYRQLYPNASPEQFINDVGAQVLVALRLPQATKTEGQGQEQEQQHGNGTQPHFKSVGSRPAPARTPLGSVSTFEAVDAELFGSDDLDLDTT